MPAEAGRSGRYLHSTVAVGLAVVARASPLGDAHRHTQSAVALAPPLGGAPRRALHMLVMLVDVRRQHTSRPRLPSSGAAYPRPYAIASSMSSCSTKSLAAIAGASVASSSSSSSMNVSPRSKSSKHVEPITVAMRAADSRLQRV